jgi:alpha-glucosidase
MTAKQNLALLLSMKGDICLYQGEELGLPEAEVPFDRLQDPFGITFWPKFKGRDGCRTPMPWNSLPHGGFSQAEPWLPVDDLHRELNVEIQEARDGSVLRFARQMIALRKERAELQRGAIRLLDAPEGVLAFSRECEGRALVCLFNMDVQAQQVTVPPYTRMVLGQEASASGDRVTLGVSGFCLLE